jgi:hypothetical protein
MSARNRLVTLFVLFTLAALSGAPADAQPAAPVLTGSVRYRVTLLRAAPGKFDDLLAEVRKQVSASGGLAVRHSQGDQWDFLWLAPVPPAAAVGSASLTSPFSEAAVAWQEDEFVRGPALDALPGFLSAGLYHFEMFDAAPGRLDELVREREMENAYLAGVGRPRNLIFRREFGAAWDAVTIGAYRDWRHYAERDLVTPEQARAAAVAAGFASDQAIGPYMRSLILSHHDTLAGPIR